MLWIAALAITCVVATWMALTAGGPGVTWDEPPYRYSQIQMANWFGRLARCRGMDEARPLISQKAILESWVYNRFGPNFHPPLAGMFGNLSHLLFGRVLDDLESRRLASGIEFAVTVAVLFVFMARRYGWWVGVVAAGSLAVMPRVVGDAHIAGTDMPVMAFWAFAALAFWNGLESRVWRVGFGVVLGLGLLVKFSLLLVVVPIAVWLLIDRAIPHLSMRGLLVSVVGTAVVGWPLAVAGFEVVRLAGAIRRYTQQERMLRPVLQDPAIQSLTGKPWPMVVGAEPPFSEAELKQAASRTLELAAAQTGSSLEKIVGHAAPFTPREAGKAADLLGLRPLALDSYIAYVQPTFDLGATTRVPGWILLLPLALWIAWCGVTSLPVMPDWLREPDSALRLWLAGLAIAPAVCLLLNPTWWHETLPQLAHFYQISVGRQGALPDIEIFYLGKKHVYGLPWHNGWVLIAATVPAAVLAAAVVGLFGAVAKWRTDPLRLYFVLHMIALPVSRMLPTPAHDGVRLMLPTFFFLAALAGWAFQIVERIVDRFRAEQHSTTPVLAVAAGFLLLPPAYWLYRVHPFELSYYNGLVGGLAGAQRMGFEPTYWYDAVTPAVLRDLNDASRGLPPQATLALPEPRGILDATPPPQWRTSRLAATLPEQRINPEVFHELRGMRRLRGDIRFVTPGAAEFPYVALLTHSSKASPFTRLLYALRPRLESSHAGVRLFSLYDPPAVARAWGLWLLLDVTDYTRADVRPRVDHELVGLAGRNYRAVYAAALRVTQDGIDAALASDEDDETLSVIRRLAARRELVELLLQRRKDALVEAAEILSKAAAERPRLLELLVEKYGGYLPAGELGDFLDANATPLNPK
jgi:hypothetical protein